MMPALLGLLLPVLAFPPLLGPGREWVAAMLAMVALGGAIHLTWSFGRLGWPVGVLSLMALIGWVMAADQLDSVNHFCGLALGLLAMGVVGSWCTTRQRFALGVLAYVLSGALAMGIGSRSTTPVHTSKSLFGDTTSTSEPANPLPLPSLHAHESVNRNALAATAMMVLPVAVAVAAPAGRWLVLPVAWRLVGLLTAAGGLVVVVFMQSRSAWLSALVIFWMWGRRLVRVRWWALAGALAFVAAPAAVVFVWGEHPRVLEAFAAVESRFVIWEQALQALRPSPWVGIGFDYFRYSGYSPVLVWPDIIVGTPHAHNIFLQTALDVGLIGLAAYVAVMVDVFRRGWRIASATGGDFWIRRVGIGATLSLVTVHVYGLLDAVALGAKVGVFQWLACGLVLAAWQLLAPPSGRATT
jgi:putative inorganic carbon (HCO3(-)) transporter